jgi:hypothetical protein
MFQWETKFSLGILCSQPISSTFSEIKPLKLLWPHKGKTLKLQLLKKPSIEFYETQDLSSTNGKPKLLFYDYTCQKIFSPGNRRGEL